MDDDLFSVGVIWEALQKPPADSNTSRTQPGAESTAIAVQRLAKSCDVNGNTMKALKSEDVGLKKEVKIEVFNSSKIKAMPLELTKLSLEPGGSARVKVEEGKSAHLPESKASGPSDIVAEACKYQQAPSNLHINHSIPAAINSNSWCAPNPGGVQVYHEKIFIPLELMSSTEVVSKLIGPRGSVVNSWRSGACSVMIRGSNPYKQDDYCRSFPGDTDPLYVELKSLTPEGRAMCSEKVKAHINYLWHSYGRVREPVVHRVSLDTVGAWNPGKENITPEKAASSSVESCRAVAAKTLDVRPEEPTATKVESLDAACVDNLAKGAGATASKPASRTSPQKQLPEEKPEQAHAAGCAHVPPVVENVNGLSAEKRIDFEKERQAEQEPDKNDANLRNIITRLLNYLYDVIIKSPNLDELISDWHDDANLKDIKEELKSAVKRIREVLSRALNVVMEVEAIHSQLARLAAAQELEETTEIPAIVEVLRDMTLKKIKEYCRPF